MLILQASGIERLESELDRRFFRRAALIKQRLTRVKAASPVQRGLMIFGRKINELEKDLNHFRELADTSGISSGNELWLKEKASAHQAVAEDLRAYAVGADRDWLVEKERMDLMEKDLMFIEAMERESGFVELRDHDSIRVLLNSAGLNKQQGKVSPEVLSSLLYRYQEFTNAPLKKIRDHFEHLIVRIQSHGESLLAE